MSPRDERAGRERAGRRTAARLADVHDAEQLFTAERPRLVGLAYRILGSRTDAEDVVQEAWIRYQRTDPDTIDRPEAWLTTVVSRLALDQLKSAHHRRATYVGPWLPEPVLTPDDPSATIAATFSVDDDEVRRIHVVRNPEKLAAIELDGDLL